MGKHLSNLFSSFDQEKKTLEGYVKIHNNQPPKNVTVNLNVEKL